MKKANLLILLYFTIFNLYANLYCQNKDLNAEIKAESIETTDVKKESVENSKELNSSEKIPVYDKIEKSQNNIQNQADQKENKPIIQDKSKVYEQNQNQDDQQKNQNLVQDKSQTNDKNQDKKNQKNEPQSIKQNIKKDKQKIIKQNSPKTLKKSSSKIINSKHVSLKKQNNQKQISTKIKKNTEINKVENKTKITKKKAPNKKTKLSPNTQSPKKIIKKPITKKADTKTITNSKKENLSKEKRNESYLSMADRPITEEDKIIQNKEIIINNASDIENPPKLNGVLIEKKDRNLRKNIYLANYMEPWKNVPNENNLEINFENQEIKELLKFLENNLNINFILDDNITGAKVEGSKPVAGNKITFKSNTGLSLKQIWDLSLTFLEMSGFSVIPTTQEKTYRVTSQTGKGSANNEPLPTFIATDPSLLPESDLKIRYIYFVENADLDTISKIIDTLRSSSSGGVLLFKELKAIIITDKSSSIKSVLKIVQELDKSETPQTLAIIRLKNADATEVQNLYNNLVNAEDTSKNPFGMQQRKNPTIHYFTNATRIFADPRSNSLITLGTRENIQKVEDFINTYIDKKSDLPYPPINIYQLKYLDATSLSKLLNDSIKNFNSYPPRLKAVEAGGVREGSKFFSPGLLITPEPTSNSLIINGNYEEYLKIKELIDSLDIEQPQVALKVLILNVDLTNVRELGSQTRNAIACCDKTGGTTSILGPNINFQFAGNNGIVTNPLNDTAGSTPASPGGERLLGNLINLVNTQNFATGTTLVTLGKDLYGFWGLLRILETITRVTVVANPFLVTSNKFKSQIQVGETRRVLSSVVQAQQTQPAFSNLDANLNVSIIPQISYDDMITMNVYVELSQFITSGELPTISTKVINTTLTAENKEVVALGGLVRDLTQEIEYKVPVLGDIPILGWLFKSKTKTVVRSSLLILISPEIIRPTDYNLAKEYTEYCINDTKETLYSMEHFTEQRDPIHKWFFQDDKAQEVSEIDQFTANQSRYVSNTMKEKEREEAEKNKTLLAKNNDFDKAPQSILDIIKQDTNNENEVIA